MNDAVAAATQIVREYRARYEPQRAIAYENGRLDGFGSLIIVQPLHVPNGTRIHRIDVALLTPFDSVQITAYGTRATRIAELFATHGRIDDLHVTAHHVANRWHLLDIRSNGALLV